MKKSMLKLGIRTFTATVLTFSLFSGSVFAKERYALDKSASIHMNAYDAKTGRNSVGRYSAGEYYIYKEFNGAVNITKNENSPGAWVLKDNGKVLEEEKEQTTQQAESGSVVKINGNRAEISKTVPVYMNAYNAITGNNAVSRYSAGKYYIYSKFSGAINITRVQGVPGGWISIDQSVEVKEPEATNSTSNSSSNVSLQDNIVQKARSYVGYSYTWAGSSPSTGFDCSGLVKYVYNTAAGINLPHYSRAQSNMGYSVSSDNLQPGDLLFFGSSSYNITHVGIYAGNGKVIHALNPSSGVVENDLWSNWNAANFRFAKRIVK